MYRFSPSTLGFYPVGLTYPEGQVPDDVVLVTEEEFQAIINPPAEKASWQRAAAADGMPTLVYVAPPPLTAEQVRADRDSRLALTDWSQAADVPASLQDRWKPYRQALRDVPLQEGFPHDVQWPVKPTP